MFKYKKYVFLILVLILIILPPILNRYKFFEKPQDKTISIPRSTDKDRVSEILLNFYSNDYKAEIFSGSQNQNKDIAITFDGLPSLESSKKIIEILNKKNIKATFFVEGSKAFKNPEVVELLYKAKNEIGNYFFVTNKNISSVGSEEIANSIYLTNEIIFDIIGEFPSEIKFNDSDYLDNVIKISKAVGNDLVVKSNYTISDNTFANESDIKKFILSIKGGSIISFKVNGVNDKKILSDFEYIINSLEEKNIKAVSVRKLFESSPKEILTLSSNNKN